MILKIKWFWRPETDNELLKIWLWPIWCWNITEKRSKEEVTMLSERWEADEKNGIIVEANRLSEMKFEFEMEKNLKLKRIESKEKWKNGSVKKWWM